MLNNAIRFFLTRSRLNYLLLTFLVVFGVVAYQSIPKAVYPPIKIDKISVAGSYAGASINTLDKMVVVKLEKDLKSLNGVEKIESFIKSGEFSIIMTLEKGSDKQSILNKSKDIISNNKSDFPSDMDDPTASIVDWSFPLINVTVASNNKTKDELISVADEIKTKLSSISNISKVQLYESTTRVYEIILDSKMIETYGLNKELLFSEIKNLSYIFPMGKIEDKKEHFFLSTINGKKKVQEYLDTLIKIGDKTIYLSDVAQVKQRYDEVSVISKLNGQKNVTLGISKNESGNAIELAKIVKDEVSKIDKKYSDIEVSTFYDTSVLIKNRLNTVISGIMFGLILVTVALYILINKRVAFIVVMGIPTAILIGVAVLSLTSYSINMITLIGALLILGVLVDDAVIIAENIQRHIQEGDDKLQAAINGTKEVLVPVLASSLTTVFSFFPMIMLSGEIGEFLKLIPIAVIILIIASLLESFIFLPIHSLHLLDTKDKELDWSKAQALYSKLLHKVIEHRRKFLAFFMIIVPILTVLMISNMRYQMFPDYDSDRVFIKGKFDINHKLTDTYDKAKEIEKVLMEHKDELALKTISFTSGLRTDNEENIEIKKSVFEFNIELHSRVPPNFVDEYVTPILSFSEDDTPKIRTQSVDETVLKLKELFKNYKPEGLTEFAIKKEGAGITANDIEILVNASDNKLLLSSLEIIKKELNNIDGIIFVDDTAKLGVRELKLKLNPYGESLGFSEATLGSSLSPLFLKSEQTKGLYENGIFEIKTYDKRRDELASLKSIELTIPNTDKKVSLDEICDFTYVNNFDSLSKVNRIAVKKVVANVNNKIITAVEALELLDPTFKKLEEQGVIIKLEGEQEQNEKMAKEMTQAFAIALTLIFISLLVMFDSFRSSLIVLSIIPYSVIGALLGHYVVGLSLSLTSVIGILGLAGVVINNAIVMLEFIRSSNTLEEMMDRAKLRLRPILITSITTFLGLSTLMFFATGQAKILQPIAISLGFGLIWGTVLTLIYLPALYAVANKMRK
jgi:multidrug efflux pump subunit AcrB